MFPRDQIVWPWVADDSLHKIRVGRGAAADCRRGRAKDDDVFTSERQVITPILIHDDQIADLQDWLH
ncbi:MAG TPA: hypothetical protein VKR27_00985 [Acidimicrobiales bacterium]|nr:hypothetical protein [Acidimicrobiales bacterium]